MSSESKRPRSWRSFIMAGVAVVALLGGAGVADAASSPATPANAAVSTASQVLSPAVSHPGPGHTNGMPGSGAGGWMLPVHGQAVLPKPGGGYQTVAFQRGNITKLSTSSMAVKSADGFTQTYTITGSTVVAAQRDGISSVRVGDQAVVIGTVSGSTVTAAKIIDWTLLQQFHQQFGFIPGAHG